MIALPYPGPANQLQQRYAVVSMDFEGADGSTTFTDTGTQASTWTRSGANVTVSTAVVLDGISSLRVNADADYLETALTSSNALPASGDWDMEFKFRVGANSSRYILSAEGTAANGPDGHFVIATSIAGRVVLVLSDGTTRTTLFGTAAEQINTGVTYLMRITRRQNTIAMSFDGVVSSTATYTANINQPAGRKIRIGKGEFSSSNTGSPLYFDSFRIFRYS